MNENPTVQGNAPPAPAPKDPCSDGPVTPAPQPHAPGSVGSPPATAPSPVPPAPPPTSGGCVPPPPGPDAPVLKDPTVTCVPPAKCPAPPGTSATCLDPLIAEQQMLIDQADRATKFKKELEDLQGKAKLAKADYTTAIYLSLLERWKAEDKDIVDLIDKLKCTARCWREQVECFICPLLYDIKLDGERLDGSGKLYATVDSMYDLEYWRKRDEAAKKARFDRIGLVLAAWAKPGTTIDAVLTASAKLRASIRSGLGAPDAGKLIFDLYANVIAMHLLIAPPKETATTGIDRIYVDLCPCDTGAPDDCCGPDTGVPTVLKDWLGPQPYLISPDQYDAVICCLVQTRYLPAKQAWSLAAANTLAISAAIAKKIASIADQKKNFEASAKAKLMLPFECCPDPNGKGGTGTATPPAAAPPAAAPTTPAPTASTATPSAPPAPANPSAPVAAAPSDVPKQPVNPAQQPHEPGACAPTTAA